MQKSEDSSNWSKSENTSDSGSLERYQEDIEHFNEYYKHSGHLKMSSITKYADNIERLMSMSFRREIIMIALHPIVSNHNDNIT